MTKIFTTVLLSLYATSTVASLSLENKRGFEPKRFLKRNRRDDSCWDHHNCDKWLDFNDLYMSCKKDKHRKMCRKTCKLCPTPSPSTTMTSAAPVKTTTQLPVITTHSCQDENDYCVKWAEMGECNRNPRFMLSACPLSCGVCVNVLSTTPTAGCVDIMPQACPGWISNCDNIPSVQLHCQKTCNLCTTSPPTTITTTTSTPTTTTPNPPTTTAKPPTTTPKPPTTTPPTTTLKPPITTTTTTPPTNPPKPPTTATTTPSTTTPKPPNTTTPPSTTPKPPSSTPNPPTTTNQSSTRPWIVSNVSTISKWSTRSPTRAGTRVSSATAGATKLVVVDGIPSAGPQQVNSGFEKAVIGIVVSGILVVACLGIALYLYKRRQRKRNALIPPPGCVLAMKPFSNSKPRGTTRDSGIVDCDVYEEPSTSTPDKPFYHVVEDSNKRANTPHRLEPIYACASNGHQNEAFRVDQPIIYDYSIPDEVKTSSLVPKNLRPSSHDNSIAMGTHYYHVLENPNEVTPVIYEQLIDGNNTESAGQTPLSQSGYQLIKREDKSVYESLDKSSRISTDGSR